MDFYVVSLDASSVEHLQTSPSPAAATKYLQILPRVLTYNNNYINFNNNRQGVRLGLLPIPFETGVVCVMLKFVLMLFIYSFLNHLK